jgi:hypothetical protein
MGEHKDDEVIILPSLMSYRDTARHGFVPPSVGTIEVKAARRRRLRLATGAGVSAALIGMSAILLVQTMPWGDPAQVASNLTWQERADQIPGIVNFRENGTQLSRDHDWAPQTYEHNPPVGGMHSPVWQQCMGNIYDAVIPNEHAVHSLEHGAVWLAYGTDLTPAEVEVLKKKIKGKQYTMMSPVDDLDAKVSLQAWGYQLKVNDVDDPRIDEFISTLTANATLEPGASCSGGNTATGTTPLTQRQAQQRLGLG